MTEAEIATAFRTAAVEFDVQAKNAGADIIGHAHTIFFQHRRMPASELELEMETLREAMLNLNSAYTRLNLAHAAMTVGETASRIRDAVTGQGR